MKINLRHTTLIISILIFLASCDAIKVNWGTPVTHNPPKPQDHNLDDSWRNEEEDNDEEEEEDNDEKADDVVTAVTTGEASYYSSSLVGNYTANGEIYDETQLTAAHKELPFGTKVQVTNLKNGKTVIVRINDRLSRVSSRSIDLSKAAAEEIEMIRDGVVDVEIAVVN